MRHYLRNRWPLRRCHTFCRLPKACCPCPYCPCHRVRTTLEDACFALWAVNIAGWTQTRTANWLGLNQGTVSRIVRGLSFPDAFPIPLPEFRVRTRQHNQRFFDF